VTAADLLGAVTLIAVIFYALLGGADFGGGIWDLFAAGPRAKEQRALIERAIGPIWEANHVWLILAIVVLFTGFPRAFAAVSVALFIPLVILLIGIVLRGAAFTFRLYDGRDPVQRAWGAVFSASSVVAPLALGTVVGALASGRLQLEGGIPVGGFLAWLSPFPLAIGVFAAVLFAYVAATYLAVEAEGPLQQDFLRRGIAAGVAVFVVAAVGLLLAYVDAPLIFAALTGRGWSLPFHLATGVAAVVAFYALYKRRARLARAAAVAQTALIITGWGAAQYPYLIVPDLTLANSSAPPRTLELLLWALGAGALLLFPCLYLLFRVFKGERPFAIVDSVRSRRDAR
jgi:cytochrome d ubiquinol oxidase subunit II